MSEKNSDLCIISIRQIVEENLTIPEYQRPYKWSTESALTLVNDTLAACNECVSEYRIGSVVLHKQKQDEGEIRLNIVDGQQRLTTVAIIIYVFGQLVPEGGCEGLAKLLDQEYNQLSCKAIVSNLQVIYRKLKELDKNQLLKYIKYFLDNCTIVKIVTEDEQEAFQFFDSQNSRGKELAPHDLLKSYHLREMRDENEIKKIEIIDAWENTRQSDLKNLFSNHLYPLISWYKTRDGINYSPREIKYFKGIKKNNQYNFSIYNRAANLYVERFNFEGMYELANGERLNQFQLTQPLIAGKRFFLYSLHYLELYKKVDQLLSVSFSKEELVRGLSGDEYVYDMYINVIMFFVDKFNWEALNDTRLRILFKWAYSLRLTMKAVYRESVNNYAQGKGKRIHNGLNMFSVIAEMQDPIELDMVVLENLSWEDFLKLKINKERYLAMYQSIFGKVETRNEQ